MKNLAKLCQNSLFFSLILLFGLIILNTCSHKPIEESASKGLEYYDSLNLTLPIIYLEILDEYLYDSKTGIYVKGDNLLPNYMQKGIAWERPVDFKYIDENGKKQIETQAGIRLHGSSSRRRDQKSFRLYAREYYGDSTFNYSFFKDRNQEVFKKLVLRAQTGVQHTFMEDELAGIIAKELHVPHLASRPVQVFLNNEFWGIYFLKEKIDSKYFQYNFQINKDSIDLLDSNPLHENSVVYGSTDRYEKILKDLKTESLSYQELSELFNTEALINYLILQWYTGNADWPNSNIKYWSESNGPWNYIFFDGDACFKDSSFPAISNYINQADFRYPDWSVLPTLKLFEHKEFQNAFHLKLENALNKELQTENITTYLNELTSIMQPQMEEYLLRFNYPLKENDWLRQVNLIHRFIEERPCQLKKDYEATFNRKLRINACI